MRVSRTACFRFGSVLVAACITIPKIGKCGTVPSIFPPLRTKGSSFSVRSRQDRRDFENALSVVLTMSADSVKSGDQFCSPTSQRCSRPLRVRAAIPEECGNRLENLTDRAACADTYRYLVNLGCPTINPVIGPNHP